LIFEFYWPLLLASCFSFIIYHLFHPMPDTMRIIEGADDSPVREVRNDGVSPEAVEKAIKDAKQHGFREGVRVKRHGDDGSAALGEVLGFNENTHGLYPGDRYPIRVQFDEGEFEYAKEDLEIVRE
jgi:hypothetical protein